MIISLRHSYIYVRTKKTGSSTIEALLQPHLADNDIVLKRGLDSLRPLLKPGVEFPDVRGPLTHVELSKIKPLLREDFWDRALKFTSERHPYEKAVSLAYWRLERMMQSDDAAKRKKAAETHFPDYLDHIVRQGAYSTFRHYAIDGKPAVDDFIKLESFDADIRRIASRIDLPVPDEIPRKRGYSRKDNRPAREILSDEQKQIVWEHCRCEFESLGYER
jgi:hypothetical protein